MIADETPVIGATMHMNAAIQGGSCGLEMMPRVSATWKQTIIVSGLDEPYTLHCEPEGTEVGVLPGDVLTITFAADRPHGFELSWVPDGLLLAQLGDSEVEIDDKRGRDVRW